jgi:nucleoside-diphosphate-sugar epimerase
MTKRTVAVVGAKGFVGSALCGALGKLPDYELVRVTRENYAEMQAGTYDILINAAMPSGRFWAKNHPAEDYAETVQKTMNLVSQWRFEKFVQISTVSARSETHTIYGQNKAAAEKLCLFGDHLVVRLSAMYGPTLSKGALVDILNHSKVFVSGESRYPFAPLSFVADWISRHFDRKGIVEVGAKNTITLKEIADFLGEPVVFEGAVEKQDVQNPEPDFPDAREVLKFMDTMRVKKK